MAETRQPPGAGELSGGSSEVSVAATNDSVTDESDTLSMPDAWHRQADWENEHQYGEGYRAGYIEGWQAAEQAIAREIVAASGDAAPRPHTPRAVLKWLIRDLKPQRTTA